MREPRHCRLVPRVPKSSTCGLRPESRPAVAGSPATGEAQDSIPPTTWQLPSSIDDQRPYSKLASPGPLPLPCTGTDPAHRLGCGSGAWTPSSGHCSGTDRSRPRPLIRPSFFMAGMAPAGMCVSSDACSEPIKIPSRRRPDSLWAAPTLQFRNSSAALDKGTLVHAGPSTSSSRAWRDCYCAGSHGRDPGRGRRCSHACDRRGARSACPTLLVVRLCRPFAAPMQSRNWYFCCTMF